MNYKNKRWRRKRENILRRDNYRCQECSRYGRTTQATVVHHIKPVETHPQLVYINDNLISLCHSCHNKMHDRNTDVLTQTGQNLLDRIYRTTRI